MGNRRSSWSKHDDRSLRSLAARDDLDVYEFYLRYLRVSDCFRSPKALASRLTSSRFMMEDVYHVYTSKICTALTKLTQDDIDIVFGQLSDEKLVHFTQ